MDAVPLWAWNALGHVAGLILVALVGRWGLRGRRMLQAVTGAIHAHKVRTNVDGSLESAVTIKQLGHAVASIMRAGNLELPFDGHLKKHGHNKGTLLRDRILLEAAREGAPE